MASLLPKNGVLFTAEKEAPAPSKDYCNIIVTRDTVIYRWWKVTLRKDVPLAPGERKSSYEDFLTDDRTKAELSHVFGVETLMYVIGLASGCTDYLPRLPKPLLIRIIKMLSAEDVGRLMQVSKQFYEVCNLDEVWRHLYMTRSRVPPTPEMVTLAEKFSWKKLLLMTDRKLLNAYKRHTRHDTAIVRQLSRSFKI